MINKEIQDRIKRRTVAEFTGEEVFQVWAEDFITSALAQGGTLYYGPTPNKQEMKAWDEAEDEGGFFIVKNAIPGMYYYIEGNVGKAYAYYN